jgi:hypothetical protein
MISDGRATVQAIKQRKIQEQCFAVELAAAWYCAMKHRVNEVESPPVE